MTPKFVAYSVAVGPLVFTLVKLAPNVLVNPAHIIGILPNPQGLTRIVLAHSAPIDLADAGSPGEVSGELLRALERAAGSVAHEQH